MKELSITDLAKIIAACVIASPDALRNTQYASRVSTDSRTIGPGDCFFAIPGPNFDGHDFLSDAFEKGASCAVVSKDVTPDKFPGKAVLKVPDTIKALGTLAAWFRKDCNFKVVAITGSVGKTTTREIAYHVLSKRFKTHQSLKNFNNFIGLPLSILAAPPDSHILILELATNNPGEIEYLSRIAAPDVALITNVHPVHLAGLASINKIAEEKLSVIKGLRPDGVLILNADCPALLDSARRVNLAFRTFSTCAPADYTAKDISINPLTSSFTIDGVPVKLPLPGRGNLENALAAWSICSSLGSSPGNFADAVKNIRPLSMRTEILQIGSLTLLSDCYNANPASMKNALDILDNLVADRNRRPACHGDLSGVAVAKTEAQQRRVFICGDMAELGRYAQDLHRRLGEQIAGSSVQSLITLGTLAEFTAHAAKQLKHDLQIHTFTDLDELCNNLLQLVRDSDIILVKGSRVGKLEIVVDKLKDLFGEHRPVGNHRSRKTEIK